MPSGGWAYVYRNAPTVGIGLSADGGDFGGDRRGGCTQPGVDGLAEPGGLHRAGDTLTILLTLSLLACAMGTAAFVMSATFVVVFFIRDEPRLVHALRIVLFELVDGGVGVERLQHHQVVIVGQLGTGQLV
ncbi:MAG: hypothetical protein ACR2P2_14550 [Nakamurella sp.]